MGWQKILAKTERFLPITIFGSFTLWYAVDAFMSSPRIQNLILIWPAATVVLVCLAIDTVHDRRARKVILKRVPVTTIGLIAATVLYVSSITIIGIDLATFAFALSSCWFLGERRLWVIAIFAATLTAACVFAFTQLISTPLPLALGGLS